MDTLQEHHLGETPLPIMCDDPDQGPQIAAHMIGQTEHYLDILSYDFEPFLYHNELCFEAFETLALSSRHSRIRVLIYEPRQVAQRGHSILTLGQRLSSRFQFRRPAELTQRYPDSFLIADNIGIIHRPYQDSRNFSANFQDGELARELGSRFQRLWDEAEDDPWLRRLVL
ncbi:DUF7931 domain-containing protein [Candidatus Venteria ishoeyi]|uniref:DUF7931 domain-containing protein n=1 Tax=Candidatus Venteria ishoeyi TaxID=1899563 RepID=A0A1H6FE70_9GAMM|nr:hypothetical protein [Candidatus Venteria ishoeyi]MDM8546987.1 hypothetical protein [Candidatus Venteria ishoeyi]SEH07314.1 Uncharacterised protein [Candidatus Venteria ishoeyi]